MIRSKLKLLISLFTTKRTFGGNQEDVPMPTSMTDAQVEVLRKKIEPGKSIRDVIRDSLSGDKERG